MKIRLLIIAGLFLASCGSPSPERTSPLQVINDSVQDTDKAQMDTVPKLDVLFIVDNSWSMLKHQVDLEKNIPAFVKNFTDNATIDFHIGVLTIWDSDPVHETLVAKLHTEGELVPLQDPSAARGTPLLVNGAMPQRFVTRDTPNLTNVLQSTILLGQDHGPEFEEMFTPVTDFFSKLGNPANNGFYRSDAHLLVIFLTDANDSTVITADKFKEDLLKWKGEDMDLVHIYSIIWQRSTEPSGKPCEQDKAGYPKKFIELTAELGSNNANILDICSDTFGAELAEFGKTLTVKVARQVIQIKPDDVNTPFTVTYGSQEIHVATPPLFNDGYLIQQTDETHHQLIIPGDLKLTPEPGAKIQIVFKPIMQSTIDNGGLTMKTQTPQAPAAAPPTTTTAPQ